MPFKHFQTYIPIPETVALDCQIPSNISKFIADMRPAFRKLIQASPIDPAQRPDILLEDIYDYLQVYTPRNAKPQPRWATYNRPGYRGPLKAYPYFILALATYALLPFYYVKSEVDLDQSTQAGGLPQHKPPTHHMRELILHL